MILPNTTFLNSRWRSNMAIFTPSDQVFARYGGRTQHLIRLDLALVIMSVIIIVLERVYLRLDDFFNVYYVEPVGFFLYLIPALTLCLSLINMVFYHFKRPFAINASLHPWYTLILYAHLAFGWLVMAVLTGVNIYLAVGSLFYYALIGIFLCVGLFWTALIYVFLSIEALKSPKSIAISVRLRQQAAEKASRENYCKLCGQIISINQHESVSTLTLPTYESGSSSQSQLDFVPSIISEETLQNEESKNEKEFTEKKISESIMPMSEKNDTDATMISIEDEKVSKKSFWDKSLHEITETRKRNQKETKAKREIQDLEAASSYCTECHDKLQPKNE